MYTKYSTLCYVDDNDHITLPTYIESSSSYSISTSSSIMAIPTFLKKLQALSRKLHYAIARYKYMLNASNKGLDRLRF